MNDSFFEDKPKPELNTDIEPDVDPEVKLKDILDDLLESDIEYHIRHIAFEMAKEELPYIPLSFDYHDYLNSDNKIGSIYTDTRDPLFCEAARLVVVNRQCSIPLIQRNFGIGYSRAYRLVEQLETAGVVGAARTSPYRDVYIKTESDLDQMLKNI
ncbi:MAG: hypothetical protein LBS20_13810 [Prevotella sp.]|jgi:DNA segregation ATPase FtsK/SpoIIIE-like protein|nr:hypothetical protein [Prevotella sp.]